ncbi:spore coat protein [Hespellia stercorisuis]|uniref:Coat F domain-containing protein n=1 Tax=Hespellia stercorisuis DSM 15480 TaxID=1121950 RepID=A0A1M6QBN2_9FIRM|nr:spore coat protein [Hespellia stercorisuis]SHK17497.1 Coat F domain-containing protein [Hespellia stercorisuis DSM 15480]
MQSIYSDKEILADALTAQKTSTSNFNMFANECAHKDVREEMLHILEEEHAIQEDVFNIMHEKGYYPTPGADQMKVDSAKQKFSQGVKMV